jgi:hypothetical protein
MSKTPTATPHRTVLVADPQIVDPHTYPGRPWPLDTLTVKYTDLYMRRVYSLIQNKLYPDSTIFLGDLFDGGREWSTDHSESPELRWHKYGENFWIKEYKRFSRMFLDTWMKAGLMSATDPSQRRQLLMNLPGNHDLGFASGIQLPVRNRFNAYFGDGSQINIIGNHSFISLDTVSLSARSQQDSNAEIWTPPQDFLNEFPNNLNQKISDYLTTLDHKQRTPKYSQSVVEGSALESHSLPHAPQQQLSQFPSILLTHVPLYRDKGTPCGPKREHWPPSLDADGKPLEYDERNALTVAGGYQYQNVLDPSIAQDITSKLENLSYAFSGDDHDYCEVLHRGYPSAGGGIREITVKSISWAMGVRKPGFQLLSLWNPIHIDSATTPPAGSTLQTQLCLLPDQLGIFLLYAKLFALTLLILAGRAAYIAFINPSSSTSNSRAAPLLPLTNSPPPETDRGESSSSDDNVPLALLARSRLGAKTSNERERSKSPKTSTGYGLPAVATTKMLGKSGGSIKAKIERSLRGNLGAADEFALWGTGPAVNVRGVRLWWREMKAGLAKVGITVGLWYLWLIWCG